MVDIHELCTYVFIHEIHLSVKWPVYKLVWICRFNDYADDEYS